MAIKGNFLLGLNFLVVSLYPIRVGATLMSSFLVNTALILAMSCAVIQFCASAFSAYANASMIFGIFGSQVGAADDACWNAQTIAVHAWLDSRWCMLECAEHCYSCWA